MSFRALTLLGLCVWCLALPDILKISTQFKASALPLSFYKNIAESITTLETPNNCSLSLLKLLMNPLANQMPLNMFLYTGKRLNDLGDYRGCINHTITRYIELKTPSFCLGICLPLECTLDSLNQIKPVIIGGVEKLAGTTINASQTEWIDVLDENKSLGEIKATNIIFFTLLGLILIISIIATILDQLQQRKDTKLVELFSIPKNLDRLFIGSNKVDKNLEVLNGVKFFAMFWTLCGRTYLYDSLAPTYNLDQFKDKLLSSFHHSFIKTSSLAGDVFFFLSGFFATISFYFAFTKTPQNSRSVILISYLRRYLRQLPLLLFSLLFLVLVLPVIRNRPFHEDVKNDINNCSRSWIWNLLYLNNFVTSDRCMNWTWYITNDFQFYLLSPFFLLPLLYSLWLGLLIIIGTIILSIIVTSMVHNYYGLNISLSKPISDDYFTEYYIKPYCRIIPYLMGILFQYIYQEAKKEDYENKPKFFKRLECLVSKKELTKYLFYLFGLAIMYVSIHTIYFFDNYSLSQSFGTAYEVAFRPLFIFGVALTLYPPIIGCGPILVDFLGHPVFASLGKVTYGIYLISPIVIYYIVGYSLTGHFTGHSWMLFSWCTLILLSYTFSYIVTCFIESPVIELMRNYLDPIRKPYLEMPKQD